MPNIVGCNDCAVRWSASLEADGPAFIPCAACAVQGNYPRTERGKQPVKDGWKSDGMLGGRS